MADAVSPSSVGEAARGYHPTRDTLLAIHQAATELRTALRYYQAESSMEDFPIEAGLDEAMSAIFELERAFNPACHSWDSPNRQPKKPRVWSRFVATGLLWIRTIHDGIVQRAGLQSMAGSPSYDLWLTKQSELPESISIKLDHLRALGRAIRRLDAVCAQAATAPSPVQSETESRPPTKAEALAIPSVSSDHTPSDVPEKCSVILLGPGKKVLIGGVVLPPLGSAGFRVISTMVRAFSQDRRKLTEKELKQESKSEGARGVLLDLIDKHALWKHAIQMSGPAKQGYGLASESELREATAPDDCELRLSTDVHDCLRD